MINGLITVGINVVFNFILIKFMAHRGLALATAIASIVSTIILLWSLKKKIGNLGFTSSIITGLKSLIAAGIMGVVIYLLHNPLRSVIGGGSIGGLVTLTITISIGALVYTLGVYLLRVKEISWLLGIVKRKLKGSS